MATKTATLSLAGEGLRFEALTGSGHTIVLDNAEGDTGARPAEMLGVALAGCTAMDVISILRKKRQEVTGYEVRVTGEQMEDHPHAFTRFDVIHVVDGPDPDPEAVRRAIELSATRYCSVGSTLASGALEIHHSYLIRRPDGDERYAEVIVIGPQTAPAALAAG
jgi:putative redox protein